MFVFPPICWQTWIAGAKTWQIAWVATQRVAQRQYGRYWKGILRERAAADSTTRRDRSGTVLVRVLNWLGKRLIGWLIRQPPRVSVRSESVVSFEDVGSSPGHALDSERREGASPDKARAGQCSTSVSLHHDVSPHFFQVLQSRFRLLKQGFSVPGESASGGLFLPLANPSPNICDLAIQPT
jgi:hypothetical protein